MSSIFLHNSAFLRFFSINYIINAENMLDKQENICYNQLTSSEGVFLLCSFLRRKTIEHLSNEGGKTLTIYREVLKK